MNALFGIDHAAIGQRVRARRQALGIRQAELARSIGVSASFIGQIERADKISSAETLARLSQALGVTLDFLVFGVQTHCEKAACPLYGDLQALLEAYGFHGGRA